MSALLKLSDGSYMITDASVIKNTGEKGILEEMDLIRVGKYIVDIFVPVGNVVKLAPGLTEEEADCVAAMLFDSGEVVEDLRGT